MWEFCLNDFRRLVFAFPKTKDFFVTLLVTISNLIFCKKNLPGNAPKLTFVARLVPMGVNIAINVPVLEGVCFVTNVDENESVKKDWIVWS